MKKLYYVICGKYRKFKNPKISHIFENTLVLSIICSKSENEDEQIFKEEKSIEIYNDFKIMVEESISQEFRLEKSDETRNYFIEEIEQKLMSRKHKRLPAGTKKYKSIIKKNKKNHDKIVLLAKAK